MKIVTVVGARPQFIKEAVCSRHIRKYHDEVLVHTGQHFDYEMSGVFFEEMNIPKPDYNLGISSCSHAVMTARMIEEIEKVFLNEKPNALIVYGDTNSTIAASLCAVKMHIPVFHIEAGNRTGVLDNPEEVNRVVTDHISTLNFCATETAFRNLENENLGANSFNVGNVMYDAFLMFSRLPWENPKVERIDGKTVCVPDEYYYMTCHRQENTYCEQPLKEILSAMNELDSPVVFPVHPRTRDMAEKICKSDGLNNIILIKPVGYFESIHLVKNAKKIVTDSGGLQCEAFYAGVQCLFILDYAVWPETMVDNRNQLSKANCDEILYKLSQQQTINENYKPFGDGDSAGKIVNIINDWEKKNI